MWEWASYLALDQDWDQDQDQDQDRYWDRSI